MLGYFVERRFSFYTHTYTHEHTHAYTHMNIYENCIIEGKEKLRYPLLARAMNYFRGRPEYKA